MLKKTIPELMRVVREDTERQVAMFALEALHDIYKETNNALLLHSVPELVVQSLTCVKNVFLKQVSRFCYLPRPRKGKGKSSTKGQAVNQGGHGTGNLAVNFSRQGKHREFSKFNFLHRENCGNTGKILKI